MLFSSMVVVLSLLFSNIAWSAEGLTRENPSSQSRRGIARQAADNVITDHEQMEWDPSGGGQVFDTAPSAQSEDSSGKEPPPLPSSPVVTQQPRLNLEPPPTSFHGIPSLACCACTKGAIKRECVDAAEMCCVQRCSKSQVCGCAVYGAIAGAFGYLISRYGHTVVSDLSNSLAGFVVLNGYEAVTGLIALFTAVPPVLIPTSPEDKDKIAVLIPIYGAEKNIQPTLDSLLANGFKTNQIYIIENTGGRYDHAQGEVYKLLRVKPRREDFQDWEAYKKKYDEYKKYKEIHYELATGWGSKSGAQVAGAGLAHHAHRSDIEHLAHLRIQHLAHIAELDVDRITDIAQISRNAKKDGFEFMLTLDDDVYIPPDFDPQLGLLTGSIKMIAYPIRPTETDSFLQAWQEIEYAASDMHKWAQQKIIGTALTVHGAVNLFEIKFFIEETLHPPFDGRFGGEDARSSMSGRIAGGGIAMARGPYVRTDVPNTLALWWNQRAGAWVPAGHHLCLPLLKDFCFEPSDCCSLRGCAGCGYRRCYQGQELLTNTFDVLRPIVFVTSSYNCLFWSVLAGTAAVQAGTNCAWRLCKEPYHVRVESQRERDWKTLACAIGTYPVYSVMNMMAGCFGAAQAWIGLGTRDSKRNPGLAKFPYPPKDMAEKPWDYVRDVPQLDDDDSDVVPLDQEEAF